MPKTKTAKKISVIIPVYNDAKRLERTLKHLHEIRKKEFVKLEIVVSFRPSEDNTEEVARRYADKVVESGNVSEARNDGAKVATGEILVFLDADALPNFGVFPEIARTVTEEMIGTCSAYPSKKGIKPAMAIRLQNFVRWTGMAKGISNLLFCHRSLFHEKNIRYDVKRSVGEHAELIHRARLQAGAKFTYLDLKRCYEVSVDRYERVGYTKTLLFWIKWWFLVRVLKRSSERLQQEYWSL